VLGEIMPRFVVVGCFVPNSDDEYSRTYRILDVQVDAISQYFNFDAIANEYPLISVNGVWVEGFEFTEQVHADCMAAVLNSGWTTVKAQAGDGYPE
jgi:hypothetical protein